MELATQIFEKVKQMDTHSQELIFSIVLKFLGEPDDVFLTDEDLIDIETARQELKKGEVYKLSDVNKFRADIK